MADRDRRDSNGSSVRSEHHDESVEEENKSRNDADGDASNNCATLRLLDEQDSLTQEQKTDIITYL